MVENMKLPDTNKELAGNSRPARSWRSRRRLIILFVLLFCLIPVLSLFLSPSSFWENIGPRKDKVASVALDRPADLQLPALPGLPDDMLSEEDGLTLALSPEEAIALNKSVPDSEETITPARPFVVPGTVAMELSRSTAINCLTSAIYYEAAIEAERGQRAVAQVVLNRVRHPAYPNNICGVVFQGSQRSTGCQFSFTCDGSLARVPNPALWKRIQKIAADAISGTVEPSVGTATHYHTVWIVPYWAKNLDKIKTVGSHIFYRWSGYWGKRAAFTQDYSGEDLSEVEMVDAEMDVTDELNIETDPTEDEVTYVPEIDPILAPKFDTGDQTAAIADNSGLAEDTVTGTLAADNDKGTLILD